MPNLSDSAKDIDSVLNDYAICYADVNKQDGDQQGDSTLKYGGELCDCVAGTMAKR